MLIVLFWIVIAAVIVGILLWGLNQLPWIDSNIKAFIKVVIIVVFAIWLVLTVASLIIGGVSSVGPGFPNPPPLYRR